ncbi:hypothetical protein C0Q70_12045 [Pomacea canaliculata]|uniref:Uncharacterized protein n=1 Tax=Pomacea canaliculata TaxID=400727 RepID=A0A2T7P0D4_POMCA|nr:hypothetical protein C0Q70_12045 [Pomacea canaliculata]
MTHVEFAGYKDGDTVRALVNSYVSVTFHLNTSNCTYTPDWFRFKGVFQPGWIQCGHLQRPHPKSTCSITDLSIYCRCTHDARGFSPVVYKQFNQSGRSVYIWNWSDSTVNKCKRKLKSHLMYRLYDKCLWVPHIVSVDDNGSTHDSTVTSTSGIPTAAGGDNLNVIFVTSASTAAVIIVPIIIIISVYVYRRRKDTSVLTYRQPRDPLFLCPSSPSSALELTVLSLNPRWYEDFMAVRASLVLTVMLMVSVCETEETCADVEFAGYKDGDTVTASVNSYINVTFHLNTSNCTYTPDWFRFKVFFSQASFNVGICSVLIQNTTCNNIYQSVYCRCTHDARGSAILYRQFNQSGRSVYIWNWSDSASKQVQKKAQISFDVQIDDIGNTHDSTVTSTSDSPTAAGGDNLNVIFVTSAITAAVIIVPIFIVISIYVYRRRRGADVEFAGYKDGDTVTALVNSYVSITFHLNTSNCSYTPDWFRYKVSLTQGGFNVGICSVLIQNRTCSITDLSVYCRCTHDARGSALLYRQFNQSGRSVYIWNWSDSTSKQVQKKAQISFDVQGIQTAAGGDNLNVIFVTSAVTAAVIIVPIIIVISVYVYRRRKARAIHPSADDRLEENPDTAPSQSLSLRENSHSLQKEYEYSEITDDAAHQGTHHLTEFMKITNTLYKMKAQVTLTIRGADLEFHGFRDGETVKAEEKTYLNVTFHISTTKCTTLPTWFRVKVSFHQANFTVDVCSIIFEHQICEISDKSTAYCYCVNDRNGAAQLYREFNMSGNVSYIWSLSDTTSGQMQKKAQIVFDVSKSAKGIVDPSDRADPVDPASPALLPILSLLKWRKPRPREPDTTMGIKRRLQTRTRPPSAQEEAEYTEIVYELQTDETSSTRAHENYELPIHKEGEDQSEYSRLEYKGLWHSGVRLEPDTKQTKMDEPLHLLSH